MSLVEHLFEILPSFLPVLVALALVIPSLWGAHWFLFRRGGGLKEEARFMGRVAMSLLVGTGIILILLTLPLDRETHKDLFQLLALLITAVITLSSTTFVSNAMAGVMLRGMQSFRLGDFLRVQNQFGRVTERGLFHTEIQTEDRDLTTLPNLFLVSHPFTVVRASGTIISGCVSLGYDTPQDTIEYYLLEAARATKLKDPFVHVLELGDFSVTYRISGMLEDVKQLLTARSKLKASILSTLHGANIEIVSPSFMNQRRLEQGQLVLPPHSMNQVHQSQDEPSDTPEAFIFDKADAVAQVAELREKQQALEEEVRGLQIRLKKAGENVKPWMERRIQGIQQDLERLTIQIQQAEETKTD